MPVRKVRYNQEELKKSEQNVHYNFDKSIYLIKKISVNSKIYFDEQDVEDDIKELMKMKIEISRIVSKYA